MNARGWFQIHLSTALALMFVASALLGLNILGRQGNLVEPGASGDVAVSCVHGWPCAFTEYLTADDYERYNHFGDWVGPLYIIPAVCFDMCCAVGILTATLFIGERYARRVAA